MRRYLSDWKGLVYNFAFFLNGLLIFLLIFESRFSVPIWMQSLGRMHPLVLHFPLVVLMLYGFWVILIEKPGSVRWNNELAGILLLIGTFTAAVAAFSGFILSKEDGYEGDALFWHKWLGVAISLISIAWYSMQGYLSPWKLKSKLVAAGFLLLLFVGGHLGGNLTHGEDFLISPLPQAEDDVPKVAMEDARVFQDLVQPVLNQKCISCHNEEKSKGNLQMQTQALLVKGGKNGVLWDTTKADLGLLISRLHLPLDDKKHMPPRGKVQLTDEEIVLLAAWVKGGSRFDQLVSSLSPQNPVYAYAQNVLGGSRTEEQYNFDAADADEVAKLNTTYRLIRPLSAESPALFVNFYNRANFKSQDIEGLLPLKDQIVSMDLSKMPVKDEDLKILSKFSELRKLILNFTDITGKSLDELKKLPMLKEISLSGTGVKLANVKSLESFPALKKVYVWSTALTVNELAELKKLRKISFETGFRSDTLILALNPPVIENEEVIVSSKTPISMKHQIPGTEIRYTLDGTEPDSAKSLVYTKPFSISKNTNVKAKAFKNGWYGSKQVDRFFFKAGYHIDSVRLILPADQKFKAKGDITIADGVKSDKQQSSGKWLGFRENDFQSYLLFKKPVLASSVTLSMLRNVGGFIFPPVRIEVWGGANEKSLKLLKIITPEMPVKETPNSDYLVFNAEFDSQKLSCIKLVAKPLAKLPAWHPGKGEKAWVFVDEVFVN
ncbi:FN3 associated domain-containing protein [Dyadobacter sp. 32]|uniref:FN3 associated domain-containing protein n=1 Tax=Dyadobacter sp. 32 TaxID=538966 RepID=UPI0011EC2A24